MGTPASIVPFGIGPEQAGNPPPSAAAASLGPQAMIPSPGEPLAGAKIDPQTIVQGLVQVVLVLARIAEIAPEMAPFVRDAIRSLQNGVRSQTKQPGFTAGVPQEGGALS